MVLWNPRYCPLNSLWAGRGSIFKGREEDYNWLKIGFSSIFSLPLFIRHFSVHPHFSWSPLITSVHLPLLFVCFRIGTYYERKNTWHYPQKVSGGGNAFLILITWSPFIWLPEWEGFFYYSKKSSCWCSHMTKKVNKFQTLLGNAGR